MTQVDCNTKRKTGKHLTDIERGKLDAMVREGNKTQTKMAQELGVSQSTVSRELRRGKIRQMAYDRSYYEGYSAEAGQRVYQQHRAHSHGKKSFAEKYSLAFFEALPEAIRSTKKNPRKHSVDSFVHVYQRTHPEEKVPCTKTVYQLIDQGVLSVRNIDWPMKTRMRPRKKKVSEPKGTNAKHLGRSIEERDPAILQRKDFGHWEVDLVLGKKSQGEPVILTMVERKTRFLLTKKVWGRSAAIIQKAVLQTIQQQGAEHFQSLTTDNGAEFSLLSEIEDQRTIEVFFAHAFVSWKKEPMNGTIECFANLSPKDDR